jgi:hypothetical protein
VNSTESPVIRKRIAQLERLLGKRVVIRGARLRNPLFRGRIIQRPGRIIIEYRDDTAGYFWHYRIIEELLDHLEQGRLNVVLYEGDIQYADIPPQGDRNTAKV